MDEYVTLSEAAASLSVSQSRVHQLIAAGVLRSTPVPEGRLKHLRGAARVETASLTRELERRRSLTPTLPDTHDPQHDALYEMKIRLDQARDELRMERSRARRLVALLKDMASLVEHSIDQSDTIDDLASGYSEVVTELLGPRGAGDLD